MNSVTAQAAELKLALEQLYKQAEEAAKPEPGKKLNKIQYKPKGPDANNDDDAILTGSLGARAFDWSSSPWSSARAGKATTLAKAMGQKVDPTISHPKSTAFMHDLAGLGLGALGGAGIGAAYGAINPNDREAVGKGVAIGGVTGLLGAFLRDAVVRTKGINRIRNDYNTARKAGTPMDLNAANPDLSRLGSLLYMGGNHRSGSVDALEQLAGRNAHSNALRGTGRVASVLPYVSMVAEPISGLGEGYGAAVRNQKLISELEKGGSAAFAARLGRQNGTMHKRAFLESLKGMGTQALNAYKGLDPTAQAAILGGGAGAAIGGVGNAMFGKRKPGVGILGRLGRGALAGGAIGGLGGAGINEAAIRMGMGSSGLDRQAQIGHQMGKNEMPSQMTNNLLGGLMTSKPSEAGEQIIPGVNDDNG